MRHSGAEGKGVTVRGTKILNRGFVEKTEPLTYFETFSVGDHEQSLTIPLEACAACCDKIVDFISDVRSSRSRIPEVLNLTAHCKETGHIISAKELRAMLERKQSQINAMLRDLADRRPTALDPNSEDADYWRDLLS